MSGTLVVPTAARPGIDRMWTRADAVYRRGICRVCGQERAIRNDGRVRLHQRRIQGGQRAECPGTDRKPLRVTVRPGR